MLEITDIYASCVSAFLITTVVWVALYDPEDSLIFGIGRFFGLYFCSFTAFIATLALSESFLK